MDIYKETGIDVDGRGEFLQEAVGMMDPLVKKMIVLYKALPGFQLLPIDDQVATLKGTQRVSLSLSLSLSLSHTHTHISNCPTSNGHRDAQAQHYQLFQSHRSVTVCTSSQSHVFFRPQAASSSCGSSWTTTFTTAKRNSSHRRSSRKPKT